MRSNLISRGLRAAGLTCALSAAVQQAAASDWTAGIGDWANPANWNGGVPNNSGGWSIGNVNNGGTAFITTTVPNASEVWAGNNGGFGTIIVTNGGTLNVDNWLVVARDGGGGNTPLSTFIVDGGTVNKRGDGFIIGDPNNCKGQMFVRGTGVVNVTGGWNGIGNGWTAGEGWLYLQGNSVFSILGVDWNLGDWGNAHGHAYIQDNATLNVSRFWIGKWDNAAGALWQSGGSVIGAAGGNEWCIGGENDAAINVYGYWGITAGTVVNPNNFQVGRFGKGVIYQSGGTNSQSGWTAFGRMANSIGVVWITGGLYTHTAAGQHPIVGEQGRGELTLSGAGTVDCASTLVVGHGYGAANGDGYLNLNGGTLSVPGLERWGTGSGHIAFNGGTVRAKASTPNFMNGITDAHVYSGNAVFDTAGQDITIAQPLMAVSGSGVTSIPVADGGAGYIAPPIVQISGDGYAATAVAEIDPAAGRVTGITVTCPGYYYFSTPTVTLVGGAPTTPATLGTPTIGAVTSGGIVKNGAGKLTLTGASDYSGTSTVNGGKLISTTDAYGAGAVSVANGGGYGVIASYANAALSISALTLAAGATSLDFDLGSFGNPVVAPLHTLGALTVNGTVTVNIADGLPQPGLVPLLDYASRSGSGTFALGTLPAGVQATLVDNTGAKTLYLNITSVGLPRWDGTVNGNWDINATQNWIEQSTGLPSVYKDGAPALFDDQATGTTTVNLTTTVQPSGVTVTNSIVAYTFTGTGKLSGNQGLTKKGWSPLTIAQSTLNDYTGPTVVSGGVLNITNLANGGAPSSIGRSSASPTNLVLSGGVLSYSGPAVTTDRGYRVEGANSTIDAQSDITIAGKLTAGVGSSFIKTGPATLTYRSPGVNEMSGGAWPGGNLVSGTTIMDGTGLGQVMHSQNEFFVGASTTNSANLVLTNTTLNVDSWIAVGRGNGTEGRVSTVSLYDANLRSGNASAGYWANVAGNLASQTIALYGSSTFTNTGDMNLAESGGSTSLMTLAGTSKYYNGWRVHVGWHDAATGTLALAQSASMAVNAWFSVGNEGGTGTFSVRDNANAWILWDLNITDVGLGLGTMNLSDNALVSFGSCFIGKGVGSSGIVNQTGGLAYGRPEGNEMHIGFHGAGTWNLDGGSIVTSNHWFIVGRWADGPGALNVNNGTVIHRPVNSWKLFRVGEDGTGVLNLGANGTIETTGDTITVGINTGSSGTMNLNGGHLTARRIIGGAGLSTVNFNGTTLHVGPNANADYLTALTTATLQAGGLTLDTGAQNIGIAQAIGGTGNLTKTGTGALAILGANTYTGSTLVNQGTLAGNGTLSGSLTVASGAKLAPGLSIGTLTVAGTLSLAAGSTTIIELTKTNLTCDQVAGTAAVTYGGTLVLKNLAGQLAAGDTFTVFPNGTRTGSFASVVSETPGQTVTWDTSKLTVDGTVSVLSAAAQPVTLTPEVSGGNMTLAWPVSQIGWLLQTQSNPLTVGLSTNWVPVAGSTLTNSVTLPIDPAQGAVFFRLVFP